MAALAMSGSPKETIYLFDGVLLAQPALLGERENDGMHAQHSEASTVALAALTPLREAGTLYAIIDPAPRPAPSSSPHRLFFRFYDPASCEPSPR